MSQKIKFLIIGSGPTGLGAAYRLKDLGQKDYLILDQNPWVGGLAASFKDDHGFTWDIGGHVQFSHYSYFDEAMALAIPPARWLTHQRESWVWIHDRFVPYPFQNNLRFLPKDAMWRCLKGLIDNASREILTGDAAKTPQNFKEWILASFGEGVAAEFMIPYNMKVWAFPAEQMSFQWIGERVATVNLARVTENIIFEKTDASWGPNNTFKFPGEGGTGAIWESIAKHVGLDQIRLETSVESIDPQTKVVTCKDGSRYEYEHLISTMPLDILTTKVAGLSKKTITKAAGLKHSSSNIIGIGVEGSPIDSLKTKCWMYFPEDNCPFYRMTMFSNYSPRNVPDIENQYSLMCEVSESTHKPVDRSRLIEDTIQGLYRTQLLPRDHKIVSTWSYSANYGYPTPSLERDSILDEVIPELDALGVYSRGRFGGWKYEVSNQDHSFMQGVEWVDYITSQKPEQTFRVHKNS